MNCRKCGAANNIDARFCGSCGNDLSAVTQQSTATNNNEKVEQLETTMVNQAINVNPVPVQETIQSPTTQTNVNLTQSVEPPMINTTGNVQTVSNPVNPNKQPNKSGSKKTVFIILAIAIVVIIGAVIGLLMLIPSDKREEKQKIDDMFNPNQLIRVKKDDKYGYINTDGKFILEANYEQATDFVGDYAVVRTEVEVDGLKKSVTQIIDKNGKTIKQTENNIEYIDEYQLWIVDQELYNSKMKKLSPTDVKVDYQEDGYFIWVNSIKNTGGIMNTKGKQTYTYTFEEGENYISIEPSDIDDSLKERYCRINVENEKYAIVNCDTGVVVYDFTENYISVDEDNIFEIKNHDTYDFISGMYIQGDKALYETNSDDISLTYYTGYIRIKDDSKSYSERYSYLHTATGEIKNEAPSTSSDSTKTEELNEWEEYTGSQKFSCSAGYGLMNNEQITLPCEWDSLEYLEINLYKYLKDDGKEYIYGKNDSKWYLIDLKNKKAIYEFNTSSLTKKEGTTFVYYTDKDSSTKKVYNLLTGKSLNVQSSSTSLTTYSNYITVKDSSANTLKYYNIDLELIYTENL